MLSQTDTCDIWLAFTHSPWIRKKSTTVKGRNQTTIKVTINPAASVKFTQGYVRCVGHETLPSITNLQIITIFLHIYVFVIRKLKRLQLPVQHIKEEKVYNLKRSTNNKQMTLITLAFIQHAQRAQHALTFMLK